jgi:hypothetical protein
MTLHAVGLRDDGRCVTAAAQMIRNAAHALVRYTPRAVAACSYAT